MIMIIIIIYFDIFYLYSHKTLNVSDREKIISQREYAESGFNKITRNSQCHLEPTGHNILLVAIGGVQMLNSCTRRCRTIFDVQMLLEPTAHGYIFTFSHQTVFLNDTTLMMSIMNSFEQKPKVYY